MSIYTASTIPLGGGSLNNSTETMAWAPLGENKYIMLYQQNSPNHIFCQVVTINGLSTPVVGANSIVRENFDYSSTRPNIRVYGNSAGNKALVLYIGGGVISYQFLNIDEFGFATPVSQQTTPVISSIAWFICEKTSDTKFFYAYRTSGSSNYYGVATVDWTNNSFAFDTTKSDITFTGSTFLTGPSTSVHPIPNSTKWFIYTGGVVMLVNPDGTIATTYSAGQVTGWGLPNGTIIPLSETKLLGISSAGSQRNVKLVNSGVAGSSFTIASANGANLGGLNLAIPLDLNRYMVMSHSSAATNNVSAMVCRIMGDGVGSVSPATDLASGLTMTMTGSSGDRSFADGNTTRFHPAYHRRDFSTIVYWAVAQNATESAKLAFKIINQPS